MSRSLGTWQRRILETIDVYDWFVPLKGSTRSEHASILRAANSLEKDGRCVIVRLWNDEHTAVCPYVCRPGLTIQGKPAKELSVTRVPVGTGTAFKGSCREMAKYFHVSKSQIARDLQGAARA